MQPVDSAPTAIPANIPAGRKSRQWFRAYRPILLSFGAAFALGWILGIIWWAVLSPAARARADGTLVIPPGTAAAILERRGAAVFDPGRISLRSNASLTVVNNDVVEHLVANELIPPGQTREIRLGKTSREFVCSITQAGSFRVNLLSRPPFVTTLVPSALIGFPVGAVIAVAVWVSHHLKLDEEEPIA